MIKLRLRGEPEEIKKFTEFLKTLDELKITCCSEPYPDRGKSVYERVYMDVKFNDKPTT